LVLQQFISRIDCEALYPILSGRPFPFNASKKGREIKRNRLSGPGACRNYQPTRLTDVRQHPFQSLALKLSQIDQTGWRGKESSQEGVLRWVKGAPEGLTETNRDIG